MLNRTQLRCLKKDKADEVIREIHAGLWFSYEWYNLSKEDSPTRVLLDEYGKGLYSNSETVSSVPNTWESQSSPTYCVEQFIIWPFAAWGIDIIGEIRPNASNGHKYIVVVIDYFSRWIEAESFGTLKAKQIVKFIEKSLICRYGVPYHIVIKMVFNFRQR